ncbi:MAG: tyrosine--tRNA ligase [SAR202 cluster bacterium]|nr:tyrosine--tRNA ligase [SAR202 cluster bacterium]
MNTTGNICENLLTRSVVEVVIESELKQRIQNGESLRIKMGFDPSAPDIHLGHAVGLRKLREFQDLGHMVVLIVGDWTAQIGDPSGRSEIRPMISEEQVHENAKTYMDQFFKIVDKEKTEVRWQSEWFSDFRLKDIINLTSRFTVAQFLAREDFSNRFKSQLPISLTELLYPILQAYDSVAIQSDVELGGTDQKFNLLVGRDLQNMLGHNAQHILTMPLIPGTDGVRKMSKSLNNYIGITEHPENIFGKTMSIPDNLIPLWLECLTDTPLKEIYEIKMSLKEESSNPIDIKKNLAAKIVRDFHGLEASKSARQNFEKTVQSGEIPLNIPEYNLQNLQENSYVSRLLVEAQMVSSVSEAKRLLKQNAVKKISISKDSNDSISSTDNIVDGPVNSSGLIQGMILRVGRRKFLRIC